MATVLIDKLLLACIKQGRATSILSVGQPPVFRLHGRMRKLETKVLEAEDTVQLMKSIAPERCQRELQESGSSDFGFAFGTLARFRVSIFKQRGFISMVLRQIPTDKADARAARVARVGDQIVLEAERFGFGDRPNGFRQKYDAGQFDQFHQRGARPPHYHDRGSDRVLSRPQEVDDQPARSRR